MRVFFIAMMAITGVAVACGYVNPCGLVPPHTSSATFYILDAVNSPCTVVVSNEVKSVTFGIAAPNPPLQSTSPDAGFVYDLCDSDAGAEVAVTPNMGGVRAWRSATQLCVLQTELKGAFYPNDTNRCDVNISLICDGKTLVDQRAWTVCHIAC